jgi:hypothetical protein
MSFTEHTLNICTNNIVSEQIKQYGPLVIAIMHYGWQYITQVYAVNDNVGIIPSTTHLNIAVQRGS